MDQKKDWYRKAYLCSSQSTTFFSLKAYLAIIKSGNICIPLDPYIEKENFEYISRLTNPSLIFLTDDIGKKLPVSDIQMYLPRRDSPGIEEMQQQVSSQMYLTGRNVQKLFLHQVQPGNPRE